MPSYEVTLSDGRKFRVEADGPPSEADILVQLGIADQPKAPDPRVVAEQDRLDPETAFMRPHQSVIQPELDQAADELPWALGGAALSAVLPGVLAKAFPYAPRAVSAVAKVAGSPVTGGAIGAAEGYRRGGLWGALTGGVTGYGVSKGLGALAGGRGGPDVAGGMSQAGRQAQSVSSATGVDVPALDALMRGAGADELSALVAQRAAPRAMPATPMAAAAPADALTAELMARETLQKPINWRTTDVTPLTRPGKGIYFGEESTPGLLRLLQDAQLAKNQPLVDKLLVAIRQRSHITGKVGEP